MPHGALFIKTRARKKKTLTEHIDLLPFPSQSLREKSPIKERREVKSIPEEKPKPKADAKDGDGSLSEPADAVAAKPLPSR